MEQRLDVSKKQMMKRHLVWSHMMPFIIQRPMTQEQLLRSFKRDCGSRACVKAPETVFAGFIGELIRAKALVQVGTKDESVSYGLRPEIMRVLTLLEGEEAENPMRTGGVLSKLLVLLRHTISLKRD